MLFSTFAASSAIYFFFSVLLLLLKYIRLYNSFCYQVLVEVSKFSIIFISIILSMFVFIMYFCHIDRKKVFYHIAQVTLG